MDIISLLRGNGLLGHLGGLYFAHFEHAESVGVVGKETNIPRVEADLPAQGAGDRTGNAHPLMNKKRVKKGFID